MSKRLTTEEFISRAKEKHGDKYDYSKVEYINAHTKVIIICPEHGEFKQTPSAHKNNGMGCPNCKSQTLRNLFIKSNKQFIVDANKVHEGKYGYSKVVYLGSFNKVEITCPIHGSFYQSPTSHLAGNGCKWCNYTGGHGGYTVGTAERFRSEWLKQPATLYLIELSDNKELFYKVGITSNSIESRFGRNYTPYNIRIIHTIETNKYLATYVEKEVLKEVKSYTPLKRFSGYTECFKIEKEAQDL